MPTPIDVRHTADLDRPFPSFSLTSNGRVYTIEIERLHSQHLYHGVLEWDPMDPEDSADELAEYHRKELDRAQRLAKDLALLWPGWKSPTMLTPTPDWRDPEFQHGSRWQGHLWAATLCSPRRLLPDPLPRRRGAATRGLLRGRRPLRDEARRRPAAAADPRRDRLGASGPATAVLRARAGPPAAGASCTLPSMTPDDPDPPPLAQLEAAVHRRPGDAGAWRSLAEAYMAADAFELSVPLLEQAVRLAPRDAEVRRILVVALHQLDRGRDALPHAREAIRLDPGDPAAQAFEIAGALEEAGDLEGAADQFRRTIAIDPDQPAAWIRLAFILSKNGKPADAVPVFERAAELRPGSIRVWNGLADAAASAGQLEKTVEAFRRSLAIDPDQPKILSNLGAILRRLGRLDEAAMAFAEAA